MASIGAPSRAIRSRAECRSGEVSRRVWAPAARRIASVRVALSALSVAFADSGGGSINHSAYICEPGGPCNWYTGAHYGGSTWFQSSTVNCFTRHDSSGYVCPNSNLGWTGATLTFKHGGTTKFTISTWPGGTLAPGGCQGFGGYDNVTGRIREAIAIQLVAWTLRRGPSRRAPGPAATEGTAAHTTGPSGRRGSGIFGQLHLPGDIYGNTIS
jgi:hypothetical protein